jgi:protein CpxP
MLLRFHLTPPLSCQRDVQKEIQMRRLITSVSLIASLAFAGAVFAGKDGPGPGPDGHGPHGPHGRGGPYMHELHDLNLTDAQHTQIKGFFEAARAQDKASHQALHALHRSYDLAVPGSKSFTTLTSQLADAEAADARDRVTKMAEIRTQIYGVLTPAQRTQLATELANRPEPKAPPEGPEPG